MMAGDCAEEHNYLRGSNGTSDAEFAYKSLLASSLVASSVSHSRPLTNCYVTFRLSVLFKIPGRATMHTSCCSVVGEAHSSALLYPPQLLQR